MALRRTNIACLERRRIFREADHQILDAGLEIADVPLGPCLFGLRRYPLRGRAGQRRLSLLVEHHAAGAGIDDRAHVTLRVEPIPGLPVVGDMTVGDDEPIRGHHKPRTARAHTDRTTGVLVEREGGLDGALHLHVGGKRLASVVHDRVHPAVLPLVPVGNEAVIDLTTGAAIRQLPGKVHLHHRCAELARDLGRRQDLGE